MEYNFKDEYYWGSIPLAASNYRCLYYSALVNSGAGSKSSPAPSKTISVTEQSTAPNALIFACGFHKINNMAVAGSNFTGFNNYILGGGNMHDTAIDATMPITVSNYSANNFRFYKMTLDGFRVSSKGPSSLATFNLYFTQCDIRNFTIVSGAFGTIAPTRCIIRIPRAFSTSALCTIIGVDKAIGNESAALHENCRLTVDQSNITTYAATYKAFNNCEFKIGGETEYKALSGNTEAALRADFVGRCSVQGITCPTSSEFGDTEAMYRWVFANGESCEGVIVSDGIIRAFEKRRLVGFGHLSERELFAFSGSANMPHSFNQNNPNSGDLEISGNAASFPANVDISLLRRAFIQSGIYVLRERSSLNSLNVIHSFTKKYGINVDSSANLATIPTVSGDIVSGKRYIVRSDNDNSATVTYNGTTYNSSLSGRTNLFTGAAAITFTASTNAVVYEVLDELAYQQIKIRVVNRIPAPQIKTGSLTNGYWYLVEHDNDQDNDTAYVTYKGVKYPPLSSFLVDGDLSFTTSGDVHLRRCWYKDFDQATETVDTAFWVNEQKPKWINIVPDDPRCFMRYNSVKSVEMEADEDGNYIASGHPAFYKGMVGDSGAPKPAYQITGAYLQVMLEVRTLCPM